MADSEGIIEEAKKVAAEIRHTAQNKAQQVLATAEATAKTLKELSDSPTNQELKEAIDAQGLVLEDLSQKLEPVLDVYKAVLLSRSFIMGLSGLVIAITAIGVGFSWLINSVTHHN